MVSDVQSGCSIIGEGEVHTGLYIGLDGLYGGESGGASGTESSRRFRACCLTSSGSAAIKCSFLVEDNVLVVQKHGSLILVLRARSSNVERAFDVLKSHITFHQEADGHHKVGRSHVDIIHIGKIRNLLDILEDASL